MRDNTLKSYNNAKKDSTGRKRIQKQTKIGKFELQFFFEKVLNIVGVQIQPY